MDARDCGNGVTVVTLIERIDAQTVGEVEKALQAACAGGARRVVCNLGATKYISSAGLRSILVAAKQMTKAGGELCIASPTPYVREILDLSGFTSVLKLYETEEQAVQA